MKITADSNTSISTTGKSTVFYTSGDLGGGIATVGYMDSTGFVSLKDATSSDVILTP